MAAQDEGRYALNDLPLADLKTWLEDNLSLNALATTIQQISGGGTTIVPQETELLRLNAFRWNRTPGWWLRPSFFGEQDSLSVLKTDKLCFRFVAPRTMAIRIAAFGILNWGLYPGILRYQMYDGDNTTLLNGGGPDMPQFVGPDPDPFTPPATSPSAPLFVGWYVLNAADNAFEDFDMIEGETYTMKVLSSETGDHVHSVPFLTVQQNVSAPDLEYSKMFMESGDPNHDLTLDQRIKKHALCWIEHDDGTATVTNHCPVVIQSQSSYDIVWSDWGIDDTPDREH
jgi:hypothetical protein